MAVRTEPRRKLRASKAKHERDTELAKNDVPRGERNHSATAVLPPMNSSRHFFIERYVDRAEQPDQGQAELAETLI